MVENKVDLLGVVKNTINLVVFVLISFLFFCYVTGSTFLGSTGNVVDFLGKFVFCISMSVMFSFLNDKDSYKAYLSSLAFYFIAVVLMYCFSYAWFPLDVFYIKKLYKFHVEVFLAVFVVIFFILYCSGLIKAKKYFHDDLYSAWSLYSSVVLWVVGFFTYIILREFYSSYRVERQYILSVIVFVMPLLAMSGELKLIDYDWKYMKSSKYKIVVGISIVMLSAFIGLS